jgi:hypothetical protein
MNQAEVQAAMDALRRQGKTLSAENIRTVLGRGSYRDIVKLREACAGTRVPVQEQTTVPLVLAGEGPAAVPPAPMMARPEVLCWQCGTASWLEWAVGIWRCRICGVDPPTLFPGKVSDV